MDLFVVSKYKKRNNSENALSPLQMVLQNLKGNFVNFVKLILFCKRCTNLRQCLTETVALLPYFPISKTWGKLEREVSQNSYGNSLLFGVALTGPITGIRLIS